MNCGHPSGLVQDCSIIDMILVAIANALEILQSCTKPSTGTCTNLPLSILAWLFANRTATNAAAGGRSLYTHRQIFAGSLEKKASLL